MSVDPFEGQALLAVHFIAHPATDIRSEIQKATAGSNEMDETGAHYTE